MRTRATRRSGMANPGGQHSVLAAGIAALTRSGAAVIWPLAAMGFGNPNLLTSPEFAGGVTDAPVRGGLITVSTMAGYDGAIAIGRDGVQHNYAYKQFTHTSGLTYTLSISVRMDDGSAPSFATMNDGTIGANSFALIVGGSVVNPTLLTRILQEDGSYRVSGSVQVSGTTYNHGVIKYSTNDTRTFKVTAYKLEQSNTSTAYTTQAQLRDFGVCIDSSGTTPVTALADLIGLILDKTPTEAVAGGYAAVSRYGTPVVGLASAWQSLGTGHALMGGVMTLTAAAAATYSLKGVGLTGGKTYRFDVVVPTLSGGTLQVQTSGNAFTISSAGTYSFFQKVGNIDGPYVSVSTGTVTAQITRLDWVEVRGNHSYQAIAGSKPNIGRVPKKLGPNLFTNGDFSNGSTGWNFGNSTWTVSGGLLVGSSSNTHVTQPVGEADKFYKVSCNIVAVTSGSLYVRHGAAYTVLPSSAVGMQSKVVQRVGSGSFPGIGLDASSFNGTVDNLVVQEVLDWSQAVVFDPSAPGDFLQTGITISNTGWVCAGVTPTQVSTAATVFNAGAGSSSSKGMWLYAESGKWLGQIGNGTTRDEPSRIDAVAGKPAVVSLGWDTSSVTLGVDGVETTAPRSGDCTGAPSMTIGAYLTLGTFAFSGPMTIAAICPKPPPASDCLAIRRLFGWLQSQQL